MAGDYWSAIGRHRLSRRRALVTMGAGALGAAFLAACGGSDSDKGSSSSSGNKSGLVQAPVDTSKTAKRGGTNKWFLNSEPAGFDLHVGGNPKNNPKNLVYSNLVSAKPGVGKEPDYSDYIPDIAKS